MGWFRPASKKFITKNKRVEKTALMPAIMNNATGKMRHDSMEEPMEKEAIKRWIHEVYEKLCALLSLYEETDCFHAVPEGEDEEFLNRKFRELDQSVNRDPSDMDEEALGVMGRLKQIMWDVGIFVANAKCNPQMAVLRLKSANWQLIYFDEIFDLMEEYPETYKEILAERRLQKELEIKGMHEFPADAETRKRLREDLSNLPVPSEKLIAERKAYFAKIREGNEREHVTLSKKRMFQEELLNTMHILFERNFQAYL